MSEQVKPSVTTALAMKILADLATRAPLRKLDGLCEQLEQPSTVELAAYIQQAGDRLGDYAYNLRRHFDALHAEAEALRAENGRLREELAQSDAALRERRANDMANVRTLENMWEQHDALRQELEAARGLLEAASAQLDRLSGDPVTTGELLGDIDTFLTATPAPEVPDHIEQNLTMAEQGERQEAVVYAVHAKGAQVDHHCPLVSPDMAADYLPGCATPLYTTPQPCPDVRWLTMRDVMNALESVPGAPVLTSNMCHAIAQQLNAHRQAQQNLAT